MSVLNICTTTLLLAVYFGNTQGNFRAEFDTCNITSLHPSFNVNCSIIDRDQMTIYFSVLEQYVSVNMNATTQMEYRGVHVTVLEFIDFNFCRVYATDAPPAFNFFKEMRNKPDLYKFPQYCPIKIGDYYMRNVRVSSENLPVNFPALRYKTIVSVNVPRNGGKLQILTGEFSGRLKKV